MCCCAKFIVKYVLIIANLLFTLLGLAIVALGVAAFSILNDVQGILPVDTIAISIIVLGCVVFLIGFLACCGAIRESRWMLICYTVLVTILLFGFIYLTVVILGHLSTLQELVEGWIATAFDDESIRVVFHVMETMFHCCGTVGPISYTSTGQMIPPSCCASPTLESVCLAEDAFQGCGDMVGSWVTTFSGAIGGVLIAIIVVQLVAVIFALFLNHSIGVAKKEKKRTY